MDAGGVLRPAGRYLTGQRAGRRAGTGQWARVGEGEASGPSWIPTEALRRALLCGLVAVVAGLLTGRPDVALLGAPLLLGVVAGAVRGRPSAVTVSCDVPSVLEQGRRTTVCVTVTAVGAEVVAVRVPWGEELPHGRTVVVPVPADGNVRVETTVDTVGRGEVVLARPDVLALAADGLQACGPLAGPVRRCVILPAFDRMPAGALPPRPSGLVGAHRTRHPGDGAELLSVRPFLPGDRVRRIDWRVTARRGEPHVRTTATDSDADVVLCLDSRIDLGHDAKLWVCPPDRDPAGRGIPGSSLDRAVRLATTIAATQLRHGDRVALVDLGSRRRWVASGTGRRQFLRLRLRLAGAVPAPGGWGRTGLKPYRVPVGAVVVVLSPFVDDVPAQVAIEAQQQGAQVLAVDVLPSGVRPDRSTPSGPRALDAVLAQRRERLDGLRSRGVGVVSGQGESWAAELRAMARARSGRR